MSIPIDEAEQELPPKGQRCQSCGCLTWETEPPLKWNIRLNVWLCSYCTKFHKQ